jgi:signal transduction histidine kinase/HAMP domain-containing protein
MKLSAKFIFIVAAVLLVAFAFSAAISLVALRKNQDQSLNLSKQEFLNLSQELFSNSSDLFFENLSARESAMPTSTAAQSILDYVAAIDPAGNNVAVITLSDRTFLPNYGHAGGVTLLDPATLGKLISANALNLTTDFDFDNFAQFANDTTNSITPEKIHLHVYNNAGLIVGYGEAFTAEKVRLEFIQEQNGAFFNSFLLLALMVFASALVLAAAVIFFFTRYVIVKPLREIRFGLGQIEKESLATRLSVKKKDEIGEIANSFNFMASRLETYMDEIERERRKLDEVALHMNTGAILLESDGAVSLVNVAAIHFLNTTDVGQVIQALADKFPSVPVRDYVAQALGGESHEASSAEADQKTFALSFVSLKSEMGGRFGVLIWLNDITAQKRLEQSKNEFMAIASHEMRTPLAVIRGNAELLLEEKPILENAESKEEIERILNGSVRLLGIVNDFLDVENLEGNAISLKSAPVDLGRLLDEIVADFSQMATDKHITLQLRKPPTPLPLLTLDRSRIQQIFINLIGNAIHYTDRGGVTVTIESDGVARVLIEDTGIGIAPEDQKRLFQKFQTGNTFLKTKIYGSGLGLYISRLLANAMGITIQLEKSEVGKGTVFCVTIPLPKA